MKRLDRALCLSAGLLGLLAFVAALRTSQALGYVVGVLCLIAGLSAVPFAVPR